MLPWKQLASAIVPGDGGEMRLYQRGAEFSIRVGSYELMNSRVHGSEDALAEYACERLSSAAPRILIGGLGMGFTLAAVLARVGPRAQVVVAELVPEVVIWNREEMGDVNGDALEDPRVEIVDADVVSVIREASTQYDAILLDVDNGPAGLTSSANDRLYSVAGLRAAHSALRPGGVLAVWSSGPDAAFTKRLESAGFSAEVLGARGHGKSKGGRYVIWVGRVKSEE